MSPVKKLTATKVKTPIKMKPRPHGVDFEEIDVRKILKPFSHSKYIKGRKIFNYEKFVENVTNNIFFFSTFCWI